MHPQGYSLETMAPDSLHGYLAAMQAVRSPLAAVGRAAGGVVQDLSAAVGPSAAADGTVHGPPVEVQTTRSLPAAGRAAGDMAQGLSVVGGPPAADGIAHSPPAAAWTTRSPLAAAGAVGGTARSPPPSHPSVKDLLSVPTVRQTEAAGDTVRSHPPAGDLLLTPTGEQA